MWKHNAGLWRQTCGRIFPRFGIIRKSETEQEVTSAGRAAKLGGMWRSGALKTGSSLEVKLEKLLKTPTFNLRMNNNLFITHVLFSPYKGPTHFDLHLNLALLEIGKTTHALKKKYHLHISPIITVPKEEPEKNERCGQRTHRLIFRYLPNQHPVCTATVFHDTAFASKQPEQTAANFLFLLHRCTSAD